MSKVGDDLEQFWNLCSIHDITSRDQLLREAVRVVRTKRMIEKSSVNIEDLTSDPEQLFRWMKERVGDRELGHFPGDRELFYKLYHTGKNLDLLDYAHETLRNDRLTGTLLVQAGLLEQYVEMVKTRHYHSILIAEAEKFLPGLHLMEKLPEVESITLLTENYVIGALLKTHFEAQSSVQVMQGSIYLPLPLNHEYDSILTVPHFGLKLDDREQHPLRETEGVAVNHLLPLLKDKGTLCAILPAKLMFQSGEVGEWRKQINSQAPVHSVHVMPDGVFRPYTSVKTYQVMFRKGSNDPVKVVQLRTEKDHLVREKEVEIPRESFDVLEDWRVELLLDEKKDILQQFQTMTVPKVKLKEVADIFRGKSILKQDVKPGPIKVLNISNLEDGEVQLDQLDTIDEEERKVKRYEILPGDLVMTCRGTVTKLAVFPEYDDMVIASANILVIRFRKLINSYFAKIFLESPLGIALIQSYQRGTTVMNLNPGDIAELELPLIAEEKQLELMNRYKREKEIYIKSIQDASNRWKQEKEQIYSELYEGGFV
jgi:hypothetical protein